MIISNIMFTNKRRVSMCKAFNGKWIGMILLVTLIMMAASIGIDGSSITNSVIAAGNERTFDEKRLLPILLEFGALPAYKSSVGYDSEGHISVWIDLEDGLSLGEVKGYGLPYPSVSYYSLWIGKKILTVFPEINSVWLNSADQVSDAAIHITRKKYTQSGLADLPTDKEGFFTKVEKDLG
ncbi:MAG TPA: hypothetical protein PL004_13005, partial [Bacillota bacterium]|nr:hypothetical protein [Bacillota bacterium]